VQDDPFTAAPPDPVEAKRAERVEDAIKSVMAYRVGRRFVWALLSECGLLRTSFTGEALSMAFNEGQRNVAIRLMDQLDAICPDLVLTMTKEAKEDDHHDRHKPDATTN
jgi:hypothetical protein